MVSGNSFKKRNLLRWGMVYVWLKDRMKERGVTQIDLAEALETDQSRVSDMVNGKRKILAVEAYKISRVVGMPVEEFIDGLVGKEIAPRRHDTNFAHLKRADLIKAISLTFRNLKIKENIRPELAEEFCNSVEVLYEASVLPPHPDLKFAGEDQG